MLNYPKHIWWSVFLNSLFDNDGKVPEIFQRQCYFCFTDCNFFHQTEKKEGRNENDFAFFSTFCPTFVTKSTSFLLLGTFLKNFGHPCGKFRASLTNRILFVLPKIGSTKLEFSLMQPLRAKSGKICRRTKRIKDAVVYGWADRLICFKIAQIKQASLNMSTGCLFKKPDTQYC